MIPTTVRFQQLKSLMKNETHPVPISSAKWDSNGELSSLDLLNVLALLKQADKEAQSIDCCSRDMLHK